MRNLLLAAACLTACGFGAAPAHAQTRIEHVLLISVDGLHAADLSRYVAQHPNSTLAAWSSTGLTYANAMTSFPSDSFPGMTALMTGGSPRTTGVWYDEAFARDFDDAGTCKPGAPARGAKYDDSEAIDVENKSMFTSIDPAKLVVDPKNDCKPVYPHQLLRVNTIFEIVRAAGHRTAWSDKHPAYDLVNGPSGQGVDDLFAPEITVLGGEDASASVKGGIDFDALRVAAILNELRGLDSAGKAKVGVPALLGMNFQAVSVTQKLKGGGYKSADAEPSDGLATALDFVDGALGQMKATLAAEHLEASTLVVLASKHGQSPIDPAKRRIVDKKALVAAIASVDKDALQSLTTDDIAMIWLNDRAKIGAVAKALEDKKADLAIARIYAGDEMAKLGDSSVDPRAPDLIVQPETGVIYTKPTASKIAEHGGGAMDDRHVALLIANPAIRPLTIDADVATAQVAPTILLALGLDPAQLQAVAKEGTSALPRAIEALAGN